MLYSKKPKWKEVIQMVVSVYEKAWHVVERGDRDVDNFRSKKIIVMYAKKFIDK